MPFFEQENADEYKNSIVDSQIEEIIGEESIQMRDKFGRVWAGKDVINKIENEDSIYFGYKNEGEHVKIDEDSIQRNACVIGKYNRSRIGLLNSLILQYKNQVGCSIYICTKKNSIKHLLKSAGNDVMNELTILNPADGNKQNLFNTISQEDENLSEIELDVISDNICNLIESSIHHRINKNEMKRVVRELIDINNQITVDNISGILTDITDDSEVKRTINKCIKSWSSKSDIIHNIMLSEKPDMNISRMASNETTIVVDLTDIEDDYLEEDLYKISRTFISKYIAGARSADVRKFGIFIDEIENITEKSCKFDGYINNGNEDIAFCFGVGDIKNLPRSTLKSLPNVQNVFLFNPGKRYDKKSIRRCLKSNNISKIENLGDYELESRYFSDNNLYMGKRVRSYPPIPPKRDFKDSCVQDSLTENN